MLFQLHIGRVFDFRVLSYAICKVDMVNEFSNQVLAFGDSLLLLRSKVPKLSYYKQEFLAGYFVRFNINVRVCVQVVWPNKFV